MDFTEICSSGSIKATGGDEMPIRLHRKAAQKLPFVHTMSSFSNKQVPVLWNYIMSLKLPVNCLTSTVKSTWCVSAMTRNLIAS